MVKRYHIMKNTSAFYRLSQMYFSERLKPYNLGWSHQLFLNHISRCPGITLTELAAQCTFDAGTVTRATRKLADEGYIRIEPDERDRRARRLYLTEKGEPLIEPLKQMRLDWFLAVTEGFSESEKELIGSLMGRMADNARQCFERTCPQPDPDEE